MKRVRKKQPYRRKKPVDLPRRALSAYNLFFRDERGKIMEEQKLAGLASTSTFGALGKAVADRWKNMTPEEHSRYKQLAAEDKIRYNREMEQYKANALSVHQLRTEEGRLAGEMMHASVGLIGHPNRYSSPQFRLGSTMLRQPHDTGFSMAQANPTPFAAAAADASNLSLHDAARLMADIQNPLELSLLLGAQDCSLSLYSRLLASQQYGNAHVPLGASSLDSLGAQQQAPLLLNHHLAWAKAERDLQVEQATQQLYQSAMASQQLQLLTAQQQQAAFASTAAGAPPPNYLALLLGSSANQSPMQNSSADCVPGKIVLDDAQEQGDAAATINPLLRHYLRQAQQNRESVKATSSIGADAPVSAPAREDSIHTQANREAFATFLRPATNIAFESWRTYGFLARSSIMMMELLSNGAMFVLTVALIVLANNPSLRRTAFKFLSSVLMLRRRNKAAPRRLVSKTKRVTSIGDTITSSVPTMMESIVESSEETADGVEEPSGVLAAAKQSTDRDTKRNVRFGSLKESAVDEQAKVLKNENTVNASLHSTNSANSRVSFAIKHESLHQPVAAAPTNAFSLDSIHSSSSNQRRESSSLKILSKFSSDRPAPSIPWLDDLANCGSSSVSSTRDESATVSEHGGEEFTNSAFSVNDSKDDGSIRSELSCRLRNRLVHGPKAALVKKNKSRNGPSSSDGTDFESMPSSLSSDMLDRSCSPFRVVV